MRSILARTRDIYLARVNWAPDGKTLYVQRENRAQKPLDLLAVDPATGKSDPLQREGAATWINLSDDYKPLKDGSLIWSSERDGYRPSLSLCRWQVDAADQRRLGRSTACRRRRAHRLYFTGNQGRRSHSRSIRWII